MKKLLHLFENIWDRSGAYLIATLILTIPLYPKFPFLEVPGIYVSIRLEDFVILVVCLIWFLAHIQVFPKLIKSNFWRAFILFWAITLLSTVSGIVLTHTVVPVVGLLNWGRRVEYMIIFLLCLDLKVTKKELKFFLLTICIVILYAFVYGLGQKYFNWPIITTQNGEYSKGIALSYMPGGHIVSTFAGHYDLASYLILVTPIIVVFASHSNVFEKTKKRMNFVLFTIMSSLAGVWLLANAASRISIISYFGAISLALILVKRKYLIPLVALIVFIVAISSTSLIGRYMSIFDVLIKKASAAELVVSTPEPTQPPPLEDRSTNIRLEVEWPRAVRALKKNPLLGTGYSSITLATDDEYLRSLGEVGIVGTGAFALCFFLVFIELGKQFIKQKEFNTQKLMLAAAIGMIPGVFLNMVFIDILEASKFAIMFWLILGITIAHARTTE